jgi:predicted phosphodiesterase
VAFCGDVVDYGPYPIQCLRWVAQHAEFGVRVDHDNALAFDVDCHCMGSFRQSSLATRIWHRALLSPDDVAFLRALPTISWFEFAGQHFRMSHATPQGDLFEHLDAGQWGQRVEGLESDFVLLGHTQIQDMRRFGRVTVVNPESVGLNRDGSGKACYAVYDDQGMTLKRVDYNVNRTVAALRSSPLPQTVVCKLEFMLRPRALEMPRAEHAMND